MYNSVAPSSVLSRIILADKRHNPFRIRFYANSPRESFRIRFYAKRRGVGAPILSPLASAAIEFTRPLFSYPYKSLFPQPLCIHIHTNPPGVWGSTHSWRDPNNAPSLRRLSVHRKSLIPAAPESGFCRCSPSTGSFTVTNFASKTWDMLRLISRGGPALHSRVCIKRNYSGG
jgi:hypothetical protein